MGFDRRQYFQVGTGPTSAVPRVAARQEPDSFLYPTTWMRVFICQTCWSLILCMHIVPHIFSPLSDPVIDKAVACPPQVHKPPPAINLKPDIITSWETRFSSNLGTMARIGIIIGMVQDNRSSRHLYNFEGIRLRIDS